MSAAVAMAGCSASVSVGGDDAIAGDGIAETIAEQYAEQNEGITLDDLTCDDSKAEVGARIGCRGRNSRDVDLEIAGEVTEIDSGEARARYRWEVIRALAPGALYEVAALNALRGRGLSVAEVSCPLRIEVIAGARVNCEVTSENGSTATAVMELTDQDGGFRISAVPSG